MFFCLLMALWFAPTQGLWDQLVNQIRKKLIGFNSGETSDAAQCTVTQQLEPVTRYNNKKWEIEGTWKGEIGSFIGNMHHPMLIYMLAKAWFWLHIFPHSQPEEKTSSGRLWLELKLTYIKPEVSQLVQLLSLILFQKSTGKQYEDSMSNLMYFYPLTHERDLPIWITTL